MLVEKPSLLNEHRSITQVPICYRPQTTFAKVMFLHVPVCPQGWGVGDGVVMVSQHALQVISQHALQVSRGSPGPHPEGRLRGLAGGSPGPHLGVMSPGPHPRGVSRPTPRGGLQAHTGGGGCIPAWTEVDPPADGCCWGWYASYWNAFLLVLGSFSLFALKGSGIFEYLLTLTLACNACTFCTIANL